MKFFANFLTKYVLVAIFLVFGSSSSHADFTKIASELVNAMPSNIQVAIQPVDRSTAKVSVSQSTSFIEKITNEIQLQVQGSGISLIDRSKLDEIMMEQEEFQSVDEFSELIKNTGADALVSLSVIRLDQQTIEISARAYGVKGEMTGKVISASKSYKFTSPSVYVVKIGSIKQGQKDRSKYSGSFTDGLTNGGMIELASRSTPDYLCDFLVDINIEFSQVEKDTEESKKAEGQAKGLAMFSQMASGMGATSNGAQNPFAGLTQGLAGDADSLKELAFLSDVEATILNISSGGTIASSSSANEAVTIDVSDQEKKRAAQNSIKIALMNLGQEVAAKITGVGSTSASSNDLLD